jgi:zinc/manganese transport system substrate-binding protein
MRTRCCWIVAVVLVLGAASPLAAQDDPARPSVVVTTEILGSLVGELVGDAGNVSVLMGSGADPHTWQPSARDSERVFGADLVVANGLGLEEGLAGVLEQAEAAGVPVFHAADHIGSAPGDAASPAAAATAGSSASAGGDGPDDDHDHAEGDPHIWLDPLALRSVVLALAPALAASGIDVADRAVRLADELTTLDVEVTRILSAVPPEQRRLVSGHGALGRFAERYDFEVVGSVVPGLSSADEPSARDLAALIEAIRATGTRAIFADASTPRSVAEAVAAETGVLVVTLDVEQLPPSGRSVDLIRAVAVAIAEGLAGQAPEGLGG